MKYKKSKFKNRKPKPKRRNLMPEAPALSKTYVPETDECEIGRKATAEQSARKIRFPNQKIDQLQMTPREFKDVQSAIEAYERDERRREVVADSIESFVGYDSLMRQLSKIFNRRVTYFTSEEGGNLSREEARERAYRQDITGEEGLELIKRLVSRPARQIDYGDLLDVHGFSPASAENIWELMKRDAKKEFESGHRAAEALEPADYFKHAWDRACYLGLRESLCEEWQPKGGIELSMIDAIAQAWVMMQVWTKESALRSQTPARLENPAFEEWKKLYKEPHAVQKSAGYWDLPTIDEHKAVEHAAQMAERCQRMYFRAIRNLRDWRRYTPQVTINNAQQVNIAHDGGQQINVGNSETNKGKEKEKEEKRRKTKRITS